MFTQIRYRKIANAWQKKYDAAAPRIGDKAPDFELKDVDGQNPIRLSSFQNDKPVALVFGSYTWPPFVGGTVSLRDIYEQYHEKVQFMVIYIREAHPVDGWWFGTGLPKIMLKLSGSKAAMDVYDPKTAEERRSVATRCEDTLEYGINTYIDEIDDAVNKAYAAHPTRLYLVGLDGRVAYTGGLGPFGFKPAELKTAIEEYMAEIELPKV